MTWRATPLELDGTNPPSGELPVFHIGDSIPVLVSIENGTNVGTVTFHVRPTANLVAQSSTSPDEVIVTAARLAAGGGIAGSGRIATVHFTALNTGIAVVAFTGASVKDPQSQNLPASFLGASLRVE